LGFNVNVTSPKGKGTTVVYGKTVLGYRLAIKIFY